MQLVVLNWYKTIGQPGTLSHIPHQILCSLFVQVLCFNKIHCTPTPKQWLTTLIKTLLHEPTWRRIGAALCPSLCVDGIPAPDFYEHFLPSCLALTALSSHSSLCFPVDHTTPLFVLRIFFLFLQLFGPQLFRSLHDNYTREHNNLRHQLAFTIFFCWFCQCRVELAFMQGNHTMGQAKILHGLAHSIRQIFLNVLGEIHRFGFLVLIKPSLYNSPLSNNSITTTV